LNLFEIDQDKKKKTKISKINRRMTTESNMNKKKTIGMISYMFKQVFSLQKILSNDAFAKTQQLQE
jgi:hypothetical protein